MALKYKDVVLAHNPIIIGRVYQSADNSGPCNMSVQDYDAVNCINISITRELVNQLKSLAEMASVKKELLFKHNGVTFTRSKAGSFNIGTGRILINLIRGCNGDEKRLEYQRSCWNYLTELFETILSTSENNASIVDMVIPHVDRACFEEESLIHIALPFPVPGKGVHHDGFPSFRVIGFIGNCAVKIIANRGEYNANYPVSDASVKHLTDLINGLEEMIADPTLEKSFAFRREGINNYVSCLPIPQTVFTDKNDVKVISVRCMHFNQDRWPGRPNKVSFLACDETVKFLITQLSAVKDVMIKHLQ